MRSGFAVRSVNKCDKRTLALVPAFAEDPAFLGRAHQREGRAFDGFLIPVLGFVFLPWTTLVYAVAYDGSDVSAIGRLFVALALLADISFYAAADRGYRVRRA